MRNIVTIVLGLSLFLFASCASKTNVSNVCVENNHDDLGHWKVYSKSDLKRPLQITMQADQQKYICVSVPTDEKLVLVVEAYGKDGLYKCHVDVKAGETVNVNDDEGHPLSCGKIKGSKKNF